ncbi:putative lipid II flippase FtsW [Microbacterium sp. YY-01]|uniref:putative lipid II flippase FtsW n=1 Tax=Microbacterium sp. YY-01 TaxID=3421634 RepID=UPI003D1661ED
MAQTHTKPDSSRHGLAARVSLGTIFTPVPSEFLVIASTALLLTIFGLVMVLSATSAEGVEHGQGPYAIFARQAIFALLGVPLMFIASRMPVAFWKRIAWPALGVSIVLQLLVFVPGLGVENDGNRNWIHIAGQNLQPSEFMKLTLALWAGAVLARKQNLLRLWKHVMIPIVPGTALVIGTVLAGKDLGTAMILFLVFLGALFFSNVRLRLFVLPVLLSVAAVVILAITSPHRMSQITAVLAPDDDACYFHGCWQQLHGIWGMASGGIFGVGLGNSQEKYGWLPAAANDYIFAIVGEELGLIGCIVVLALFALFAVGAFHVVRRTDDPFVRIVTGAIVVWVMGQSLINIGVVLRIVPVLGVPLPFMSQGGTALLSILFATGVLLSFARSLPAASRDRVTE